MADGPEYPERKPRRQEVIERALDAFARRLPKALPAKVTKYDASTQKVHCKVLVQRPFFDETDTRQVESIPIIANVPVEFPGSGGFRVTFPISDGNLVINGQTVKATTGLLVWCDRSIDKWLSGTGAEVDPEFDHAHAHADAVFIPGLNPFGSALQAVPTSGMSIGRDVSPSDIEIDGQGNVSVANGTNAAARATDPVQISAPPAGLLATWMSQVETAINLLAGGSITPLSGTFLTTPGMTIKSGSGKVKIG